MNFKEMIEDKRVLLLGPASYLYEGTFLEDLDDYDVVIKLNRMVETDICKNFVNDRCDVLYHCINFDASLGESPINFEKLKKENVKMLRVAYPPVSQYYYNNIIKYNNLNANHRFPTTMVDSNDYKELFLLCNRSSPNTGTIAMYDIFLQNPKELTIRGITMFSGGYNKHYREKIVTEEEVRELNKRVKNHNIDFQKNFLISFLKNEKIKADATLVESVYGKK